MRGACYFVIVGKYELRAELDEDLSQINAFFEKIMEIALRNGFEKQRDNFFNSPTIKGTFTCAVPHLAGFQKFGTFYDYPIIENFDIAYVKSIDEGSRDGQGSRTPLLTTSSCINSNGAKLEPSEFMTFNMLLFCCFVLMFEHTYF